MMLRSSAAAKSTLNRSRYTTNSKKVLQLLLRPVFTKPQRSFALFNAKMSQSESGQQRSQDDILRNIDTYRKNIRSKTQQGYGLSRAISESVEQDKHLKLQRYEIFIDKMQRLYKSEMRFAKKQEDKFQQQRNAIVYTMTPLKEILKAYNDLTQRGFNSEATVETLQNISAVLRSRGFKGRVQGDYSNYELGHSWRMQKLIDDMKFGLRPDQFYSAHHLAQTNLKLGDIGYKSTELIPIIFEKLNTMLDERQLGFKTEQHELSFKDAVYGGTKGFVDRHYIFKGFQNSEEFNEYLQILMDWEKQAAEVEGSQNVTREDLDSEAAEVQRSMADIINSAVQVKELQKEHQSSIDNLRQQYFKMSEAADKFNFLQENQYIKYDLLELQELLVQGGYMEPEEAASSVLSQEPFDQRMQRAADVFYDYVVNYAPEMLSPQHNSFYETAVNTDSSIKTKTFGASNSNYLQENQNVINLKTLSQALVGLSEQALSFSRDIQRRDYLNKFYEDYLMPLENKPHNNEFRGIEKIQYETVLMERGYLRAWQQFKENADRISPRIAALVKEDKDHIDGQLNSLAALSACRLDQPALRNEIVGNILRLLNQTEQLSFSSVVTGLKGLAESSSVDDRAKQLSQRLANRLDVSSLSFTELIDTVWSLSALQQYDVRSFKAALAQLNALNFERVDNDLKYDEYMKLLDVYNALRFESPKNLGLQITNVGLLSGLQARDHLLNVRFVAEESTKYDPFKQRVVQALSKGLTNASVEHQVIMENELYQNQTLDTDVLNSNRYPYKPDIVMGYKGHKVGVFVLPETQTTRDTNQPNGAYRFRMRVLEQAQEGKIRTAVIAVPEVVNYDIEKMKLDLNSSFNLTSTLDAQLRLTGRSSYGPDFALFSDFGARFIASAVDFIDGLPSEKDVQKMDTLVNRMYQLLQLKQSVQLKFETSQRATGYDELRFSLMKLSLLFDSLSKECKDYINGQARLQSTDFKGILQTTLNTIPRGSEEPAAQIDSGLDRSWMGTRQEVELPVSGASIRKSIVPELINQRFMWVDDYFHYDDWRAKQKQVFDNFNLITVPLEAEEAQKFFFDKDHHNRRIPQGIFPYPNHKRQLMLPAANNSVTELLSSKNHDDFVLFEKEPFKMMVISELKKAETLQPIDEDTSMITNLQNIKQGLKSDYSDKEILNTILSNMNFTEQLIDEHIKVKKSTEAKASQVRFVPRDAEKYRKFVESAYFSKDREDPYTHFYLKEAKNKELVKTLISDEKQRHAEFEAESRDTELKEDGKLRRQKLQDKIEDILLSEEIQNQDLFDLSSAGLKTEVNVRYDMRSLVKSEFIHDIDPDLTAEAGLSAEEYLALSRRRAETKLIKSKIIYKINHGASLSNNEKAYLKQWVSDIRTSKDRNLINLRDSMLPAAHTKLTIGDVDAKSLYALNSISRVQLERERHGTFSLNDLVVELSHFLDEDVVNKIETEIFSDKLRNEWGLSQEFKVVETRNKEIGLVLNELEELAWRSAGQLSEKDVDHLKVMLSVKRNRDYFDRQFYDNDMSSLKQFAEAANQYDDRLEKIERWIVRKEDEFQTRVIRPPKNLQKTDQELFSQVDLPLRRARERLAARLLIQDEYGNPIDKEYKDLTSRELHTLTENMCLRLYLFNYEYPAFVPQIIRAVREHPSLLNSDRDQLELYCRMFEVDWRGDRSSENKQQFMSSNPIYLDGSNLNSVGEISNEVVKDKLQRACAPYVEETAAKIIQQAAQ